MEFMSALGSQGDAYRPSIFELDAQQKLRDMLQPAVQYIVASYAQRYPRLLIRLVNNHEEFYAVIMFMIERYYLKEWGASFAENFYGLRRVSSSYLKNSPLQPTGNAKAPPLTRSEINRSLLVLVALPYIKCRLDLLYNSIAPSSILGENEREEREAQELEDPDTRPLRKLAIYLTRLFRAVYPYVNGLYYGSNLAYNIAYLFGKTRYYTPWLHLIGLEMKRMSMADYRAYYEKATASSTGPKSPLQLLSTVFSGMIEFLKVLLPMSIFFYKFLEWWYSSEFARGGAAGGLGDTDTTNAVPPPQKIKPDPRGVKVPSTPNTCPICLSSPINNPTALPSGYVFCYTCAFRYVEDHGRCPITWTKVRGGTEGLTKVYADSGL